MHMYKDTRGAVLGESLSCGFEYSDFNQVAACPIPHPPEWPPILQVPAPQYSSVCMDFPPFSDFQNPFCWPASSSPMITMLFTGTNQHFGESFRANKIQQVELYFIFRSPKSINVVHKIS